MLSNEGDRLFRVVVCTPRREYFGVANLEAHHFGEAADPQRTTHQHDELKRILEAAGSAVVDVEELAGHPNSVFTRDVALVTPDGYIKLRMGLPSRRGEEDWMAGILESLGKPCAGEIEAPGTVEGGDVILMGSVAFVGLSERSNRPGVEQLSGLLGNMGYEIRSCEVRGCLHIGGIMSAIGSRRVLACTGCFPDGFFAGFDVVEVSRQGPSTGNVICMDDNRVLANPAENAAAIEVLEQSGVSVVGLDLSEFRKGSGGPTCLILPVDRGGGTGLTP